MGESLDTHTPRPELDYPLAICRMNLHGRQTRDEWGGKGSNECEYQRGEYWKEEVCGLITVPFFVWGIGVNHYDLSDCFLHLD